MTETLAPVSSDIALAGARRVALRPVLILLAGFLVVSAAMEAVLVAQSVAGSAVDGAIWRRGSSGGCAPPRRAC